MLCDDAGQQILRAAEESDWRQHRPQELRQLRRASHRLQGLGSSGESRRRDGRSVCDKQRSERQAPGGGMSGRFDPGEQSNGGRVTIEKARISGRTSGGPSARACGRVGHVHQRDGLIFMSLGRAPTDGKVVDMFCRSSLGGPAVDMVFERRLVVDHVTGWDMVEKK